ncbi:hypothetical protein VPHD81_0125 [Vibrio phage D81]
MRYRPNYNLKVRNKKKPSTAIEGFRFTESVNDRFELRWPRPHATTLHRSAFITEFLSRILDNQLTIGELTGLVSGEALRSTMWQPLKIGKATRFKKSN